MLRITSWDCLGDISASIDLLQNVHKQVGHALKIAYCGATHMTPDNSAAVHKIVHKINNLELHTFKSNRIKNSSVKPVIDTLILGKWKLKSSTVTTFNRKVCGMMVGEGFNVEEDELPGIQSDFLGNLENMD
ncbi:hypothetical protein HD554DRAFT_2027532 [Boletus coccyginus]|nr:hypothetical protein HD554DRAFT_2027532 [Boletus coccyginus]